MNEYSCSTVVVVPPLLLSSNEGAPLLLTSGPPPAETSCYDSFRYFTVNGIPVGMGSTELQESGVDAALKAWHLNLSPDNVTGAHICIVVWSVAEYTSKVRRGGEHAVGEVQSKGGGGGGNMGEGKSRVGGAE